MKYFARAGALRARLVLGAIYTACAKRSLNYEVQRYTPGGRAN